MGPQEGAPIHPQVMEEEIQRVQETEVAVSRIPEDAERVRGSRMGREVLGLRHGRQSMACLKQEGIPVRTDQQETGGHGDVLHDGRLESG